MLYLDILGTAETLYFMAKVARLRDPITLEFERRTIPYHH